MAVFSKIFGDANARYTKSLQPVIDRINSLEPDFIKLSDGDLLQKSAEFRARLVKGEALDEILPEAFAAVREAAKRTLGQRHYDVQLIGGIVMHQGKIAEMRTGEGKTLVATLAMYLNALSGSGVHLVTVNDYLARRDAVWMGQVYHALGMSVGCVNHDSSYVYDPTHEKKDDPLDKERDIEGSFHVVHEFLRPVPKKDAYGADITYGTNNEYGFDYLRDNMAYGPDGMVQLRGDSRKIHHFAIVDEVDSILIDEARTPLIISAPDTESTKYYETFSRIVPRLTENTDYTVDEKLKAVSITDSGIEKVEQALGIKNMYEEGGVRLVHHLEQALKAHVLFKRDKDYVVKDGEVLIVDEFTGRLMPGRRWSEGLHQAIEAKEGVKVEKESRTLATITFQNYFRLYTKLAGMTGTAQTSAEEFHKVYKLDVVSIPTNKPVIRIDSPDRIYKNQVGKMRAIVREVKERNENGQPVLIGTPSIEKNEVLSTFLRQDGIEHNVLNAKNHEKEGEIIAQAGRYGSVTVATNLAGRGVDIILGGNPPDKELMEKVRSAGGLHVIGTERHEARRIDDQLRGRSGRQGDPGSTQFFVSTEDELARIFGGDRLKNIMETLGVGEDEAIENKFVSNAIQQAQGRIEGHNFDIRKYVLEYDDVMNKHRETIYGLRHGVLFSDSAEELIREYLDDAIHQLVMFHTSGEGEWNLKEIAEGFKAMTNVPNDIHPELVAAAKSNNPDDLVHVLESKADAVYDAREKDMGVEQIRRLEKIVLLRTIDAIWMDHIDAMEYLRDSVRLRAYGQRDPLVEYKIEGQKMYEQLLSSIKSQVANIIFKVSFTQPPKPTAMEEQRPDIAHSEQRVANSGDSSSKPHTLNPSGSPKIGRNDPCPCGAMNPQTGKVYKYKKCGMINAPHHKG